MLRGDRQLVERARKARREMPLPEGLLWRELRKRPDGVKFRKLHPGGFYVLDFFCSEAKLCVEVDGEAHNRGDQPEFDFKRSEWLRLHDIETLRMPAAEILRNLDGAVAHILETAKRRIPPRHGEGDREAVEGQSRD